MIVDYSIEITFSLLNLKLFVCIQYKLNTLWERLARVRSEMRAIESMTHYLKLMDALKCGWFLKFMKRRLLMNTWELYAYVSVHK